MVFCYPQTIVEELALHCKNDNNNNNNDNNDGKKSFHVYEVGDKPSFSFQPKRVNIYLTPCEIYVLRKTKIRRQTVEVE